ncbi:GGDEF domain-containing protein [Nocardia sp. NPDC052566]|uniref:GGDEF domain-containing protein n=1 Tax=Nocardia sp. NPDC052566 TaxID=3364330 RepID=UPI0037C4FFD2
MSDARTMLTAWWQDPVDYCWQVHTLVANSALGGVKLVVASGGVFMAVIGLLASFSSAGPRGLIGATVVYIVFAYAVFWALRWALRPWPTARESLVLVGLADLAITASVLQNNDHSYGVTGLILLMVTGGYLAFFHNAKVLAWHAGWALFSVVLLSALLVMQGADLLLAVAEVLIMVAAVVVVLPTLQFVYWLLRTETMSDPLTKLLNRRGLEYRIAGMLDGPGAIGVISVDLDRFKTVNDTFGHRVGDEVLVRIAQRLRSAAEPCAVVARIGGEEFLIVGRMTARSARVEAEQFRRAIAESDEPIGITASIGVAIADGGTSTFEYLLQCADAAMYHAKRCGGNLVVVNELSADAVGSAAHLRAPQAKPVS